MIAFLTRLQRWLKLSFRVWLWISFSLKRDVLEKPQFSVISSQNTISSTSLCTYGCFEGCRKPQNTKFYKYPLQLYLKGKRSSRGDCCTLLKRRAHTNSPRFPTLQGLRGAYACVWGFELGGRTALKTRRPNNSNVFLNYSRSIRATHLKTNNSAVLSGSIFCFISSVWAASVL